MRYLMLLALCCAGCNSENPQRSAEAIAQSAQSPSTAALEKRVAELEALVGRHREAILQVGGAVDSLRKTTAGMFGENWPIVRSPDEHDTARATIDDDHDAIPIYDDGYVIRAQRLRAEKK